MKTLSVCVLLGLLSLLAYGGIADALSGAGQALPATPAARSIPAPVPAAANNASTAAEDFAEYLHLHTTRGEGISFAAASGIKRCAE